MSRMKSFMMDQDEKFWSEAQTVIGESECVDEFVSIMMAKPEAASVVALGVNDPEDFDSGLAPWVDSKEALAEQLRDSWDEFWSRYV